MRRDRSLLSRRFFIALVPAAQFPMPARDRPDIPGVETAWSPSKEKYIAVNPSMVEQPDQASKVLEQWCTGSDKVLRTPSFSATSWTGVIRMKSSA